MIERQRRIDAIVLVDASHRCEAARDQANARVRDLGRLRHARRAARVHVQQRIAVAHTLCA